MQHSPHVRVHGGIPARFEGPGCHVLTCGMNFGDGDPDSGWAVVQLCDVGGMLLKGRLELTMGDEVRTVEAGAMFIIPPNTPHQAVAVDGPAVVLDVFSPVREDYAELFNKYIPTESDES